jgi:peptide/nickel transport system substrate-binding protein
MRTPPRRARRAAMAFATAAMLAAGVIVVPGSVTGWAAGPTTFIWGRSADADTLDMPVSTNGESAEVAAQVFNTLARMKPGETNIEPDLATSWSVSPDGLVWTFKLRQGVTFQDGTPWNAEAAKFNFDRWADTSNPYHAVKGGAYEYFGDFLADTFKETRAPAPDTFQIVLKAPSAPLIYNLSIIAFDFASPASIKQYGATGAGQHPVGTGPYKFVEWVRDDHITLVANPAFFRPGLPKTQRVIYRVIKDNAARFLALKSGEIHAMELPNPDDVRIARADPALRVGLRPSFDTGWVKFNLNLPLFKDHRIREAVALAINKRAIVDGLYGGYGEVADQLMPPVMWGRSPTVKAYPYDPERARKLLAEAGYPNGFSTDFWYIPVSRPYFPSGKEIGTAIASDLDKVGIHVNLLTEDWATYLRDGRASLKFPMYMAGWIGDNGDPDDWLGFFFSHYDPKGAAYSYNNPTVLSLVQRARTLTSQAERAKVYARIAEIVYADIPQVPIAHAKVPILMRTNVHGLVPQPDGDEYMETVELK